MIRAKYIYIYIYFFALLLLLLLVIIKRKLISCDIVNQIDPSHSHRPVIKRKQMNLYMKYSLESATIISIIWFIFGVFVALSSESWRLYICLIILCVILSLNVTTAIAQNKSITTAMNSGEASTIFWVG